MSFKVLIDIVRDIEEFIEKLENMVSLLRSMRDCMKKRMMFTI